VKEQLKTDVTKIGVALNIDKHTEEGSHWVGMFIDLKEKYIFYFDSSDGPIPKEVTAFTNKVVSQAKALNIKLKKYNNQGMQHQEGLSECGMYVLYFIINLLEKTKSVNDFRKKRIPDEEIASFRTIYFNKI
jgi:Ulp1 family protease